MSDATNFVKLMDALQQGANATSNTLGFFNQQNRIKDQSDLFYMDARLDTISNDFMNTLNQRNDYENWETEINNYMDEQRKEFIRNTGHGFIAREIDKAFYARKNSMLQQAAQMSHVKQVDDVLTQDAKTVAAYKSSSQGQARVNKISRVYASEYANGMISRGEYEAKLDNLASEEYLNTFYNEGYNLIDGVIASNGDFSQIAEAVENSNVFFYTNELDEAYANPEAFMSGTAKYNSGKSFMPDDDNSRKDPLKKQAIEMLKTTYENKIVEMQKNNANELSQYRGEVFNPDNSIKDQIQMCDLAIDNINVNLTGKKLSEEDRNKYITYFSNLKKDFQKMLEACSSGKVSSEDLKRFELTQEYKYSSKSFYENNVLAGNATLQEAADAVAYNLRESWNERNWKESEGMTPEQKEEAFILGYSWKAANDLLSDDFVMETLESVPLLDTVESTYKGIVNEINKHPERYSEEALPYLASAMIDIVASTNITQEGAREMVDKIKKELTAVTLTSMKNLYGGNEGYSNDIKGIGQGANDLMNNDYVHTDNKGKVIWAPGSTKKNLSNAKDKAEKIAKQQMAAVASAYNVDVNDVKMNWEQTETDVNPVPVFRVGEDKVKIQPTYTKNMIGKDIPTGYQIVKEDGTIVYDPNEAKDKKKEASKQTANFEKLRQEKEIEYNASLAEIAASEIIPKEVKSRGYSQEDWKNMEQPVRTNLLRTILEEKK